MTTASPSAACRIRPIGPGDRALLERFYAELSPDSLEARFLGASPGIGDVAARFFCGPDHEHREGIVAEVTTEAGEPRIVGHVCLEPIDPGNVEMAVAVADSWQRQGLARAMLDAAFDWAQAHRVTRMSATMRASNGAMIGLLRSLGREVVFDAADGGVIDIHVDIPDALPHAA